MKQIVECIPNFSEGRDPSKIDAVVRAIGEVPGVFLLDRSSDADHNRSVITMAGEPEAILEAALRAVGKATEVIDLRKHSGAHPRIGATDVLPFVPVSGVSLGDCVALARRAGQKIWEQFHIPVYFYEAAATRPERANLETLRKGHFEGLRKEISRDVDRMPDVGESRLHDSAGAIAVGARKFLIAYNINLNTADIEIAKRIAKTVRYSTGGLRFVKAMAVDLRSRGLAQVSMNLTDFEQTPLHQVFEMVKSEAARHGVGIAGSEIVGLVPQRAIEAAASFYLQLENFSGTQVFENRMYAAENEILGTAASSFGEDKPNAGVPRIEKEFTTQPAESPRGSVPALAITLAQRLTNLSAGLSANAAELHAFAARFDAARRSLAALVDRDAAAFSAVMAAQDSPRKQVKQREGAIQRSLECAAGIQLEVARAAAEIFESLGQLETLSGPSILSDVLAGRGIAASAVRGALENVAIHLESIEDSAFSLKARTELQAIAARVTEGTLAERR